MSANPIKKFYLFFVFSIFLCFSFYLNHAYGDVMTGATYKMESDSINFAGAFSSTTVYSMEDTMGEIATGYSASTDYALHAGFLQSEPLTGSTISLSISTADVMMSHALGGVTGGTSNGSVIATVITDDPLGYSLYIEAERDPALQSLNDSIADYVPSGTSPDYNFSVASGQSVFGFSPNGDDIVSRYKNDGVSACDTGSTGTSLNCWDGLSTSQKIIAGSTGSTAGTDTTLNFRVGIGASRVQTSGWYYATTTLTAVAL